LAPDYRESLCDRKKEERRKEEKEKILNKEEIINKVFFYKHFSLKFNELSDSQLSVNDYIIVKWTQWSRVWRLSASER
jgi:hypothetical protein